MKTTAIFVILVAILVIKQLFKSLPLTDNVTLPSQLTSTHADAGIRPTAEGFDDKAKDVPVDAAGPDRTRVFSRSLIMRSLVQARSWWEPLKSVVASYNDITTAAEVGAISDLITSSQWSPIQSRFSLNPFTIITGTISAIGSGVSAVGTGLVNLVTGGDKGTTTTTPFPYPMVAKFFSNPGALATDNVHNTTTNLVVEKCLATLIKNYADSLVRMNGFMMPCVMEQKFKAIWLLPQLMGLLQIPKLLNVPGDVKRNCKYKGACKLKMIQTTVSELEWHIGKVSKAVVSALPTVSKASNAVIGCIAWNYGRLGKDLPKLFNLSCLKV